MYLDFLFLLFMQNSPVFMWLQRLVSKQLSTKQILQNVSPNEKLYLLTSNVIYGFADKFIYVNMLTFDNKL